MLESKIVVSTGWMTACERYSAVGIAFGLPALPSLYVGSGNKRKTSSLA